MVGRHGPALLRVANQFSLCHDDALDAYQRALEIYLRRMETVEPASEGAWMRVVVKHEAMAIRKARAASVDVTDTDFDASEADGLREVSDTVAGGERVGRSVEALEGAQAGRGAGAAAQGRRAVLRRDRAPLRVVLHEGQPLDRGGPQAVPQRLQRDRVGRGVRGLRGDARGALGGQGHDACRWSRSGRTCGTARRAGPPCARCASRARAGSRCSRRSGGSRACSPSPRWSSCPRPAADGWARRRASSACA